MFLNLSPPIAKRSEVTVITDDQPGSRFNQSGTQLNLANVDIQSRIETISFFLTSNALGATRPELFTGEVNAPGPAKPPNGFGHLKT